jgi:hypothetical protein
MKKHASRTGISVAVSAAAMSVVCTVVVPYGYPWPSLAWAVVACAAAVWVANVSSSPIPQMSAVIRGVEAESPFPAVLDRGVVSRRAVS